MLADVMALMDITEWAGLAFVACGLIYWLVQKFK